MIIWLKQSISDLGNKLNQLTTVINRMEGKSKLPAQLNYADISAKTLRSGRTSNDDNDNISMSKVGLNSSTDNTKANEEQKVISNNTSSINSSPSYVKHKYIPNAHFPSRLAPLRKELTKDEEVFEVFKTVRIKLPLFTIIQQIPRYAKLLKELCKNKRRTTDNEKVIVSGNI